MASIEPDTKQASRGSGTDAVGGSHGGRRADSVSGSCRHAASADRASDPAAACIISVGGFCVCETHWGGKYRASPRRCYKRRQPAALKPRLDAAFCGGGKERRIGEYKARHVETEPVGESTHVALCIHPEGSKLGSVREDADTERENRCATNEEAEELPSVDYESDAVRRLDTMRGHGWRRAACKAAPSHPTGRVCNFMGVDQARRPQRGPSLRQSEVQTLPERRIGIVRV